MPNIDLLPQDARADFLARLKRVEGQAKGIQMMIEDGRDCLAIFDQVASVKAAVSSLSGETLEAFAMLCVHHPEEYPSANQAIEHMSGWLSATAASSFT